MAYTYQVILRPIQPGQPAADSIQDTDGTVAATVVVGSAPSTTGVLTGNNLLVLQALLNLTVQASSAQAATTNGLRKYISLIQSAGNTSTVETALGAL
jgi:hypothetical protein